MRSPVARVTPSTGVAVLEGAGQGAVRRGGYANTCLPVDAGSRGVDIRLGGGVCARGWRAQVGELEPAHRLVSCECLAAISLDNGFGQLAECDCSTA